MAKLIISRFAVMITALVVIGVFLTYPSATEGVRDWDLSVNESLASNRSDRMDSLADIVTRSGDTLSIIAIAALIAIGLAVARRWLMMAFIPTALLIEVSTFGAVNYIVRRPRPDVETVGFVPSTFSYPSGHVAATLVCWLGLAYVLHALSRHRMAWIVAAVGTTAICAMGWARVYLGHHYVLDVVAGVAMGLGSLLITVMAFRLAHGYASQGSPDEYLGVVYDGDDDARGDHGVTAENPPKDRRENVVV